MNRKGTLCSFAAKTHRISKIAVALGFLSLMLALAMPHQAAAQQAITIDTLLIQLWPEYDQPSMLVQYTGQTNTDSEVTLTFTLPESASLHVTAYPNGQGGFNEIPDPVIDGNRVTITSPNGSFHVEFYDEIAFSGVQREYALMWAGDYVVTSLQWDLQMPPDSSDVATTPRTNPIQQGALDHYIALGSGLAQGEAATFEVSYQRSTDVLAVDSEPAEPLSDAEAVDSGDNSLLIAALIIVLVAMIGAGAYTYFKSAPKLPSGNKKQRATSNERRAKGKSAEQIPSTAGDGRFCTQCGSAAQSDDKFCRKCGTALRES